MKNEKKLLVVSVLLIAAVAMVLLNENVRNPPSVPENRLKLGDLILTSYHGGEPFQLPLHGIEISIGYWDHVGIYAGEGEVIESLPDLGVHKSSIFTWKHRGQGLVILRVNTSDEIKAEAVKFAEAQLGESYDWDWLSKRHADSENEWYCGELVWAAYFNQGIDLDSNTIAGGIGGVAPQEIHDSSLTYFISSEILT